MLTISVVETLLWFLINNKFLHFYTDDIHIFCELCEYMCCYSKLASLMLNLILPSTSGSIKMVKTKRDIKSPRKRISGTISRPISRARPTTTHLTTANVSANIRVVIRVRPPNNKEQGDNQRYIILLESNHCDKCI